MTESHLEFYRRWHLLSKPYIAWQLEQFRPYLGKRVADVGCGLGNFTESLLDRDFYLGIDLDKELLAELSNKYGGSPKVKTLALDATSPGFPETLRSHGIDTIICANVIEHIENDRKAVENMIASLPPGGHLCILVPALQFLFGTLDTLDGHFRRYTKRSLTDRFQGQPVKLVSTFYFNLLGVPGWFVKGRILKQKTHTNDNYAIMNALLPVVKPLERLIPPPLGMSVIAICKRDQ